MKYLGDFLEGSIVRIYFSTNAADGSRVAFGATIEVADIKVYKNGLDTARASEVGYTLDETVDSMVGIHCISIDTSDNTDAGFYASGNDYVVVLYPDETVDSKAVSAVLGQFSIANRFAASVVPQTHLAGIGSAAVTGAETDTYIYTQIADANYWVITEAAAVNTLDTPVVLATINAECHFVVGNGLDRVPSTLNINARFTAATGRRVHVWAYNYLSSNYDQVSDNTTAINHSATAFLNYQYILSPHHVSSLGATKIRFTCTYTVGANVLSLNYVGINSVAVSAAGLTANAIATAVWNKPDSGYDESTLGYNLQHLYLQKGLVSTVTSTSQFVGDSGNSINDSYNGMLIMIEDVTDSHYEVRRIVDYIGGTKEFFLDRALGFTPVAADEYYILSTGYGNVNVDRIVDNAITAASIADAAIDNATFAADVGSTAYTTNVIALAVRKVLDEINLDTLAGVSTGVAADADLEAHVVAGSVLAHLMGTAADVSTFDASTDSLEAIRVHADTIKAETVLIVADTGELQTNQGNWLTATGFATPTNITAGTITTVGTVNALANNAITAAAIATGAIDADALAADAITEIWATAMSDLAQGAPSATASVLTAINYLYEAWRNKTTTTATLLTLMKDDGTTGLTKSTLSDDGTTFTKTEMISGA